MTTVDLKHARMSDCVRRAKRGGVIVTSNGRPVAVLVRVRNLDAEDLAWCRDADFWRLIAYRRKEKTISRAALQTRLTGRKSGAAG